MVVWIFQTGEPLQIDGDFRPMRAMTLARVLRDAGHEVTIWSSNFFHQKKVHRFARTHEPIFVDGVKIILIDSPGYSKNIGLGRLFDHFILGLRLKSRLKTAPEPLPNIAFLGYPPIEFAYVASEFLRKSKVPYIIDVKDQWPQVFLRVLPRGLRELAVPLLYPYFMMGKKIIKNASFVSSMTIGFVEWAESFAEVSGKKLRFVLPFSPLVPDQAGRTGVQKSKQKTTLMSSHSEGERRIFFVGNFTLTAYDFTPIVVAARMAQDNGLDWKFILCGDGPALESVRLRCKNLTNVEFHGSVSFSDLMQKGASCDVAVAPIKNSPDFLMSVPNKLVDYLALNLPIFSSLRGVSEKLVGEWDVGIIYEDKSREDLFNKLRVYFADSQALERQKQNCALLFEKEFNTKTIYNNFLRDIQRYVAKID